jgi:hypothetical protein
MGRDDEQRTSTSEADVASSLDSEEASKKLHPVLGLGLGTFMLLNVGLMLSLPPVLRGRGAPFLPTFQKNMDAMFRQLQKELQKDPKIQQGQKLTFVDLGSGDGRIVFRAAQEKVFDKCIGYEINPLLHLFAKLQRIFRGRKYWSSTNFFLRDIWKADLRDVDVVAVVRSLAAQLVVSNSPHAIITHLLFFYCSICSTALGPL